MLDLVVETAHTPFGRTQYILYLCRYKLSTKKEYIKHHNVIDVETERDNPALSTLGNSQIINYPNCIIFQEFLSKWVNYLLGFPKTN